MLVKWGKLASFPFLLTKPLERIHCNLWGPSLVIFAQGFCFYVIFIDNFSRYTCFYPSKLKSYFIYVFLTVLTTSWESIQQKISLFQCDGRGEFTSNECVSHLARWKIKQLIFAFTLPNKMALLKETKASKLGLSMMFHSKVPQQLRVKAFSHLTSLIICYHHLCYKTTKVSMSFWWKNHMCTHHCEYLAALAILIFDLTLRTSLISKLCSVCFLDSEVLQPQHTYV